jgi:UDP-N-acetylglucosamine--N-acetylmuramyl-(pentapeptide) pyrophosphoryl-undecaprenol N-acetylglucosamine transferase
MKTIVFTGGGTAGHVFPNIAIIEELLQDKWSIHYIGMNVGPEKKIVEQWNKKHAHNISFHGIESGKYRRSFSLKNIQDLRRIYAGYKQSISLLSEIQPLVLFSKGGFVSVPPAYAAHQLGIPVLTHESDISIGLANKLINRIATKIYTSFPTIIKNSIYTGNPIRKTILQGSTKKGLGFCNFTPKLPVILIMGGSQGSSFINDLVKQTIPYLLCQYQIVHLTGINQPYHVDDSCYKGLEFAGDEMADLYACSDLIIGRAGANSLFEGFALEKPMILIPLPKKYSRGEQIKNAEYFGQKGLLKILYQNEATPERLVQTIQQTLEEKELLCSAIRQYEFPEANKILVEEINSYAQQTLP